MTLAVFLGQREFHHWWRARVGSTNHGAKGFLWHLARIPSTLCKLEPRADQHDQGTAARVRLRQFWFGMAESRRTLTVTPAANTARATAAVLPAARQSQARASPPSTRFANARAIAASQPITPIAPSWELLGPAAISKRHVAYDATVTHDPHRATRFICPLCASRRVTSIPIRYRQRLAARADQAVVTHMAGVARSSTDSSPYTAWST